MITLFSTWWKPKIKRKSWKHPKKKEKKKTHYIWESNNIDYNRHFTGNDGGHLCDRKEMVLDRKRAARKKEEHRNGNMWVNIKNYYPFPLNFFKWPLLLMK